MSRSRLSAVVLDLLFVSFGFVLAQLGAWFFTADVFVWELDFILLKLLEEAPQLALMIVTFTASMRLMDGPPSLILFIERLLVGCGTTLTVQALASVFVANSSSLELTLGGGFLAAVLSGGSRHWVQPERQHLLLIGFDQQLVEAISSTHAGILGMLNRRPPGMGVTGLPYLGDPENLASIAKTVKPSQVVVCDTSWLQRIPLQQLLQLRLSGTQFSTAQALYENTLQRVPLEHVRPADFLYQQDWTAKHYSVAAQAIYSNLLGLSLFVLMLPVLILMSLLVFLFGGPGPVFERKQCYGYQAIPFTLLRFRTVRTNDRSRRTWIGKLIVALRLARLPHLINVVRGEMSIFGPRPVRLEFASSLAAMIPFYMHRFTVKPGMFGWAGIHHQGHHLELVDLEYDFYYIKMLSLPMDIAILLRSALRL